EVFGIDDRLVRADDRVDVLEEVDPGRDPVGPVDVLRLLLVLAEVSRRVEELLRDDRREQLRLRAWRPLARLVRAAALEPIAHRRDVEPDDRVAVEIPHPSVVVRHELHRRPHPTCSYASRIQPANSSSIDETRKWWTNRSFWYGEALRMRGSSTL